MSHTGDTAKELAKLRRQQRRQDRRERFAPVHSLSPEEASRIHLRDGCWCAPLVLHVPPQGGPVVVESVRDADRLAQLGFTDVVVRP